MFECLGVVRVTDCILQEWAQGGLIEKCQTVHYLCCHLYDRLWGNSSTDTSKHMFQIIFVAYADISNVCCSRNGNFFFQSNLQSIPLKTMVNCRGLAPCNKEHKQYCDFFFQVLHCYLVRKKSGLECVQLLYWQWTNCSGVCREFAVIKLALGFLPGLRLSTENILDDYDTKKDEGLILLVKWI